MEREYYSIDQAAELAKIDVEDIIHFGATDRIAIYVSVDGKPANIVRFHINRDLPFEVYTKDNDTTGISKLPLAGLYKLTSSCLKDFEFELEREIAATLDFGSELGISPQENVIWVRPEPSITLTIDKLIIKHPDLKLLVTVGTDENPKGNVSRKSLLKFILGTSMAKYGFDPKDSRNDKLGRIKTDLDAKGLSLDEDTIRKILQAASELATK